MRVAFTAHGTPAGQGSKRHIGRGVMVEASKNLRPWREAVKAAALDALPGELWQPFTGPVVLTLEVVFHRPRSHFRTGRHAAELRPDAPELHVGTPDLDKIIRSVCDALTEAGVWGDDRQVAQVLATKLYELPGQPFQGAHVEIEAL